MDQGDEAILLSRKHHDESSKPSPRADETRESDFFVGSYQEERFLDSLDSYDHVHNNNGQSSFLPTFDSMDDDNDEAAEGCVDSRNAMASLDHLDAVDASASVRDLPIEPIVEEYTLPEERHQLQPQLLEGDDDEEKRRACETIEALAQIFYPALAKDAEHGSDDFTLSPVSVRDLVGGEQPPVTSSIKDEPKDKEDESSHSWSAFGIFSLPQSRKTATVAPTTGPSCGHSNDEETVSNQPYQSRSKSPSSPQPQQQQPSSPHVFRMLRQGDRADSLPSRLPRKSSMKRITSALSASTEGSASATGTLHNDKSFKRTVSFGKLETREYSIALSDHPSCSFGPPISLGWDFRDKEAVELETYEEQRSPRRSMHQMLLSYNVRRYLLLKRAGYSHRELETAMQEVERVKRQRLVTDLFLPASKLDETMEDVVGHLKRVFGGHLST